MLTGEYLLMFQRGMLPAWSGSSSQLHLVNSKYLPVNMVWHSTALKSSLWYCWVSFVWGVTLLRTQMNFYLYVFSSFSDFVETQCVSITTGFSSSKINFCSASRAKYVAVNLFVASFPSLRKKEVLTLCTVAYHEKKRTLKKCVRAKIIITMIMNNKYQDKCA